MSDDDWFKRKFDWLQRIASDPTVPRLALAIAVMLTLRYLNARSHQAWPSIKTLAHVLNAALGAAGLGFAGR